jgi:hypothetical protein
MGWKCGFPHLPEIGSVDAKGRIREQVNRTGGQGTFGGREPDTCNFKNN